jgi:integrase
MARQQNHGLRKVCGCARRTWAKCPHSWHFNFKPKHGSGYRFAVDSEADEHIEFKTKAEELAEGWRIAIRAGTFRRRAEAVPAATASTSDVITVEKFGALYAERLGKPVSANHHACVRRFCAFVAPGATMPYGAVPVTAMTEDAIEVFFASLRTSGAAESTINKYIQMTKALFRWATKKGYLSRNPAADSELLKRRKHAQRNRRLGDGEEARLLEHAGPHLQRLIIGALETGCRRGELLGLTWRDVNLDRREITLQAASTKTRTGRVMPISARLLAVLQMAQTDPMGEAFGPSAHVFGDSIGNGIKDIKKAWETCLLKAHSHTPRWHRNNTLSTESREALRAIDLEFRDLRHEAGSRLLEAGWPIHNVAHMLGHANISQTSTYLNATKVGLQEAMRRLDASRCKPVASEGAKRAGAPLQQDAEDGPQDTVN